jgi:hypothetical protein
MVQLTIAAIKETEFHPWAVEPAEAGQVQR